jgi:hypothetical protein
MKKFLLGTFVAGALAAGSLLSGASALEQPAGKPILTIAGNIGVTNAAGAAQFDRSMLEGMGMVTIETTTPWHSGVVKFEGVPLKKLMEQVDAKGERAVAVALNDYRSEIPLADFSKYNVILALKRDGEYMPVRDKGPLFIVYPYDSDTELKSQKYYSRSAWQVTRIEIK